MYAGPQYGSWGSVPYVVLTLTQPPHVQELKSPSNNSQLVGGCYLCQLHYVFCRGAFSIVKRCVQKESGKQFAAKIINKKRLTARGELALTVCVCIARHVESDAILINVHFENTLK